MALPPEQINIKRRREEEPVETLCTESLFSPLFFFLPHNLDPSNMILSTFFSPPYKNSRLYIHMPDPYLPNIPMAMCFY